MRAGSAQIDLLCSRSLVRCDATTPRAGTRSVHRDPFSRLERDSLDTTSDLWPGPRFPTISNSQPGAVNLA
jgi:hypothetical protein